MRILILHGYSATNLGDGMLIDEAVELAREAFPGAHLTVGVQYPQTFRLDDDIDVLTTASSPRRFAPDLFATARGARHYDLILGVGGGYLRAGYPAEAAKAFAAHVPQLMIAAFSRTPSVYLPQSIGPLRGGTRAALRALLRRVNTVYLRDDRSVNELDLPNAVRFPDLALLSRNRTHRESAGATGLTVLSVRNVRGAVPRPVVELADTLAPFDGFVQSTGGGNDDTEAMESLQPRRMVTADDLYAPGTPRRVVVAMRLHAALLAINAGHWVIHLAYERKGFGAFDDLGLASHVHRANAFDVEAVREQLVRLHTSQTARDTYDKAISDATLSMSGRREHLVSGLRSVVSDEPTSSDSQSAQGTTA